MSVKRYFFVAVAMIIVISQFSRIFTSETPMKNETVLFVTAHPDDETMFFGPTIRHVTRTERNNTAAFLVLSNGGAEGIGEIRAQEMVEAAGLLGISAERVKVLDDPALPDSMDTQWDPETVASRVGEIVRNIGARSIVTFDRDGVSDHPNHKAVYEGCVRALVDITAEDPEFKLFTLYSVPIWRKYLFSIDSVISRVTTVPEVDYTIISGQLDYLMVSRALKHGHKSQMTWYRKLWTFFSRYMIVNDLGLVDVEKSILNRAEYRDNPSIQKKIDVIKQKQSDLMASNIQTVVKPPPRTKPVVRQKPSISAASAQEKVRSKPTHKAKSAVAPDHNEL